MTSSDASASADLLEQEFSQDEPGSEIGPLPNHQILAMRKEKSWQRWVTIYGFTIA